MTELTSRDRMLRTMSLQEADFTPCCFMSFTALRKRVNEDFFSLVDAELRMGLDSMLFFPAASRVQRRRHPDLRGLPLSFHPEVTTRHWRETRQTGSDILHKEYSTPGGVLSKSVDLREDWPHGDYIPFVDDYQIPRSVNPLITESVQLEALQYLLVPPEKDAETAMAREAVTAREFAADRGVLLAGGWGVGMDMANWLCGMQELMILTIEQPGFVADLLEMIHVWNLKRMELVLSTPLDLYIRRAWYEGCDFVTPTFFREAVVPHLKAEAELAHEKGAKFGYICSSGIAPFFDDYLDAGIDVLIGVDPVQGSHTNMAVIKKQLGSRICTWGGVSGAVTVEMGTEDEVREAVRTAMNTLGPTGFVLCPVDNITVDEPKTWQNLDFFIDEWKQSI